MSGYPIELLGGPLDGKQMVVRDLTDRIHFPMQPAHTFTPCSDGDVPQFPKIQELVYRRVSMDCYAFECKK